ncbi:hypothetical protein B296_00048091 [Ensete ventricosum]|uniref:Uncharacterized protein n=1 Tax=Ensete ventricosum TaxID=4639 RepID=A0A426X6C6_ENSVE|nr:hypothetical protein B296_00048091 [Ensete ventricosum]
MASLFKRRRSRWPVSSPASPGHLAEEPAAQSGDGDGWLSSLVSGAGKLVSAKTKTSKMVNDWLEGSIAIVTEIETKSAIEQLLLRETFTR